MHFFVFLFCFFFWAAEVSNLSRSQLCSVRNMELDFWMNKIQDKTQSWRRLLIKVFYCVYLFMYIMTTKFIKVYKKIKQARKKLKAWILLNQTCTEKTNVRSSFETEFIFCSLKIFKNMMCVQYDFKILDHPVVESHLIWMDRLTWPLLNPFFQSIISFCPSFVLQFIQAKSSWSWMDCNWTRTKSNTVNKTLSIRWC